jgi:hypothetical protein
VSARLSPDGMYVWDGGTWVPVGAGAEHGGTPSPGTRRVDTSWTRPIQYVVAAWCGVQALWVASLPFWYIKTMTQYADAMNLREQQLHPGGPTLPPDLVSTTNTEMTVVFYVGVFVLLAILVFAMVGTLKRWTWAYYAILLFVGLEVMWFVLGVLQTVALSALAGQYVGPPDWMVWMQLGFAAPSAALFVWMLVAAIKRGPWAIKKVAPEVS